MWFLPQPVDGLAYINDAGNRSWRSKEPVIAWRYAVVENDEVPDVLFLRILAQLPLPSQAIYSSGGKSLHALIRVDAQDKDERDDWISALKPILATLGADPKALTAVRLSRLPRCRREQTGNLQELYFLNPKPTSMPLWDSP